MITIEEKIKLFTKIVYDKVERENKNSIDKFNDEFSKLLEEKKNEFTLEADRMSRKSKKEIEKECLQTLSRARIDAKKLILEKEKSIINKTIKGLIEYAEGFTKTDEYSDYFKRLLLRINEETESTEELDIYLTEFDRDRFSSLINKNFSGKKLEVLVDNSIIGGIVAVDVKRRIKIDMSLYANIEGSRDLIGLKIVDIFN